MNDQASREVTRLLQQWAAGDAEALQEATDLLYSELRAIAGAYFRSERSDHTLQPTALINEAYMRLLHTGNLSFENRRQFLGLVARIMRQVLVDHARQLHTAKRGSGASKEELQPGFAAPEAQSPAQFLVLDDALTRLAAFSERQAKVIELRYFAGLSVVEAGEALGISAPTVSRDQRFAEAWLKREMLSP